MKEFKEWSKSDEFGALKCKDHERCYSYYCECDLEGTWKESRKQAIDDCIRSIWKVFEKHSDTMDRLEGELLEEMDRWAKSEE